MRTATPPRTRPKARSSPPVRRPRGPAAGRVDHNRRLVIGRLIMVTLLVLAGVKLVTVQTVQSGQLRADGDKQRVTRLPLPAERGSILDRSGAPMAFSVQAKALVANPFLIGRDQGANAINRKTRSRSASPS
jgi:cell division protein FtsI (penicillin-binding protein 3)